LPAPSPRSREAPMAKDADTRLDALQTPATVVGRQNRLEGTLTGTGAVRIEGALKGSVTLEAACEVAEGASVEADLHGTVVRVAGTVTGNVSATELVELLATAVVKGDVSGPALHVVEGARLEGRVEMRAPDGAAAQPPRRR
jgi:cytoskeletal protein CcmA (bactofilin family)